MRSRFIVSLVLALLVSMFAFAFTAWAQGTIDARATATSTGGKSSDQPLVFAEGGQATRAQADTEPSGPLADTTVDTFSTDQDGKVEKIRIPTPDCTAKQGASLVLQDDDGTQGDLIDDHNVEITEVGKGLKVTRNRADPDADIKAFKVRGGDKVLDNGGLTIVTSTDIECKGDNPPPETTSSPLETTLPPETTTPPPETTTPPPETTIPPPVSDGACQNPQEVITVGPTTENTRTPFTTTGDVFRVSYDVAFEDPGPFDSASIDIEDRFGLVDYAIVDKDEKNSFIVTEGAGTYDLVVNITPPNGATYTVTVEDCMGSETTTPPPVTSPTPSPTPTGSPTPTTSPTPGPGAPGPDSECPGARVVNTTTGTGDKQSPVFGITGDSFRVTTTITGNPRFLVFSVTVNKENGGFVTDISRESPGTDSSVVNAGPGNFFLDILAFETEYTITVEDCAGSSGSGVVPPPGGSGGPNPGPANNSNGVIPDTTSGQPLPNTGGMPLYGVVVSGLVLASAGVLLFRSMTRRNT